MSKKNKKGFTLIELVAVERFYIDRVSCCISYYGDNCTYRNTTSNEYN